jgi:hypothetical protein
MPTLGRKPTINYLFADVCEYVDRIAEAGLETNGKAQAGKKYRDHNGHNFPNPALSFRRKR